MSFPVWLIISLAGKKLPQNLSVGFFFHLYFIQSFYARGRLSQVTERFSVSITKATVCYFCVRGWLQLSIFSRMKSLFQRREKHLNEIIYTARNNQHIIREAGVTAAMNTPFYYYYYYYYSIYFFSRPLIFAWTWYRRNRSPLGNYLCKRCSERDVSV